MTNLTASTDFEKALKGYIDENVTDELAKRINSGKKTLAGCAQFIIGEMRKRAKSGCAIATDQEVFGLAMHFFEEDSIEPGKFDVKTEVKVAVPKAEPKAPTPKKETKTKAPDEQLKGQVSIFDLIGGMA